MPETSREADYVIVGAGAVGMAFADTLLTDTDASIIMVDRRHKPGGHWNDAYPFIRLHSPSIRYGVNSAPLGDGRIDQTGLNKGFHELASGHEICAYFDQVMRQRFLPSGRVTWLPLSDYDGDGTIMSLANGERTTVTARKKTVDVTLADTRTPATHPPQFPVAPGARCIPPNGLVRMNGDSAGFVVIGAGKTSIDTVIWLLEQGVDPRTITWIRPRDPWLYDRRSFQIGEDFFAEAFGGLTHQLEAGRDATSLGDLYARLEKSGVFHRIDPQVEPTMFRCAIVSEAELEQLRRVANVVRKGHVRAIEENRIVLDGGEIATSPRHIHVHCTADGIPQLPKQPVFQESRIKVQYVRMCQPTFSGALIAHIEATLSDDDEKNALCHPVPLPNEPIDWLKLQLATARNAAAWSKFPGIRQWMAGARLDGYSALSAQAQQEGSAEKLAILERYRLSVQPGLAQIAKLLANAG